MDTKKWIEFIELVKRNPMLYNKRSGSYKRHDIKMKKWFEIAVIMGFEDAEMATKKWKYLRDKYVKVRKGKRNLPTGSQAEDEALEWPLMPYLQFLDEYIQQRSHYSNVKNADQNGEHVEADHAIITDSEVEEEHIIIETEAYESESEDTAFHTGILTPSDSITPGTSSSCTPGTSRSATPGTSHRATPGTSRSATPGTSRSATPGTSRIGTPSTSHGASPNTSRASSRRSSGTTQNSSAVDEAILNLGSYFAQKTANDSDVAFCNYLATEMSTMSPLKKNQLKKIVLNFMAELQDG